MDAFAWGVVGALAGVVGAAAATVFGLIPLLRDQRDQKKILLMSRGGGGMAGGFSRESAVPLVVGEIPQEPTAFQPRAGLLAWLDGQAPGARVVVVRAMTGMRGVGKTQLAADYARSRLAEGWRLVAWVNAEEPPSVLAGLAELACDLGLVAADGEAAGRAVRHWLEADGERCLLVFDNATDPAVLRPFIPAAGAAQVIITSNEQSMGGLGTGVLVEVFTEQEALAFLAARTGLAETEGGKLVAAELGCLPLALAQAAAVIAEQHIDYDTYLERLRAMPIKELLPAENAGQYPRGVAASVLLSVDAVRVRDNTEATAAMMELLAVLSPSGVRRTVIHAAGEQGVLGGQATRLDAEVADRALAELAGASLLTFSIDGTAVTVHRLVMRVIRDQLAAKGTLAETCTTAAVVLAERAEVLTRTWHEDRTVVRDLTEQIIALFGASVACQDDTDLTLRMTRLRGWALLHLLRLGDSPEQAIGIARQLLADEERLLGSDHPQTLRTYSHLAVAYQDAGRTAEAILLHEQGLADQERLLSSNHPRTLITRCNLAIAYGDAGRIAEAIVLHEQNLADQERLLGGDHVETLRTRRSLAVVYGYRGRTAEAIVLHEQNLADQERVLGSDHPETLETRHYLAVAYGQAGRTAEAIALHEQNLRDQERVLGTDHPLTLETRDNLAAAYRVANARWRRFLIRVIAKRWRHART